MSLFIRALIAAAILTAFLALTAGRQVMARQSGQEIVLQAAPVDPRDILLGHYATLSYPIERLELNQLAGDDDFTAGDAIWLSLREEDGVFQPVAVTRSRPAEAEGVVLEGRATTDSRDQTAGEGEAAQRLLFARYDLPRRYYADAQTAAAMQTELRDGDLQVILSVKAGRKPVLKGLVVKGERRLDTLL